MRKLFLILFISLSLIGCSQKESTFKDNLGHSVKLSELNGKWLVLSYWATWCHTCMKEIPELNRFYQKNHTTLLFFGVNYDGTDGESIDKTLEKMKITFPVLTQDPITAWNLGAIEAVPATFIINPQGKVAKKIIGPVTEQSLLTMLNELQHSPA